MGCGASARKRYTPQTDAVEELKWEPNRRLSGTAHILIRNSGPISDSYDLDRAPVSKGNFSKVRLGTHRDTLRRRAVKCVPKARKQRRNNISANVVTSEDFENEVRIISRLDHPNIVRAFETFEDSMNFYLVMEYCSGGNVLDSLASLEEFSEGQAAVVIQQVLRGVGYMHKHFIAHRDIRTENMLLAKTTMVQDSQIKVCDLGSASFIDDDKRMRQIAGSRYYSAPEMDGKQRYTELVDAWSIGVVTFTLLCGFPTLPQHATKEEISDCARGAFVHVRQAYTVCSKAVQSFLEGLLQRKVENRMSVEKAQKNLWVRRTGGVISDEPMELNRIKTLREHSQVTNLKKRGKQVLAQRLDLDQIGRLQDELRNVDAAQDGIITHKGLAKALQSLGRVHEDVNDLIEDFGVNETQRIDYTDFVTQILQQREHNTECICADAFMSLDQEHKGTIAKKDVKLILLQLTDRQQISQAEIDAILSESDGDRDRQIDFDELLELLRGRR